VLRDKMPIGLQHKAQRTPGEVIEADLGTLPAGKTKLITMEATAIQPGRFVNEVGVSALGVAEVKAQAGGVVPDATLSLRKTGPQKANPNQQLDFVLILTNTGKGAAANVRLVDTLPEGLDFVSATEGGTYDAKTRLVQWEFPSVASGQSKTVSVR